MWKVSSRKCLQGLWVYGAVWWPEVEEVHVRLLRINMLMYLLLMFMSKWETSVTAGPDLNSFTYISDKLQQLISFGNLAQGWCGGLVAYKGLGGHLSHFRIFRITKSLSGYSRNSEMFWVSLGRLSRWDCQSQIWIPVTLVLKYYFRKFSPHSDWDW